MNDSQAAQANMCITKLPPPNPVEQRSCKKIDNNIRVVFLQFNQNFFLGAEFDFVHFCFNFDLTSDLVHKTYKHGSWQERVESGGEEEEDDGDFL